MFQGLGQLGIFGRLWTIKTLLLILLATSYFLLTAPKVFAANPNFSDNANVTYSVASSGSTHVTFSMSLTNTTDTYYASSYKIHLGFQDIQNVQASDNSGPITPDVEKSSDGEDVSLPFNSHVFGKDKSLPFTFSFNTSEVASLNGSIWEVNIPGLSNADDFTNFTVHIIVPSYFGQPTFIKPDVGDNTLTFTKDQLGKSGISLAFGDKQVYAFHLAYNLQNTQLFPVRTEIALPPNTTYQHIEIDTISPRPTNVTEDQDGNWLAQYELKPSQKLKVLVAGKSFLSLTPGKQSLSQNEKILFTKSNQYWQTQDPSIRSLATSLKTPEAIYNYVVTHLHYDFARVSDTQDRLGAVGVLEHPDEAVCLEFTDLFIALARAAGIPAKELDGYGYTQNTSQRPLSLQKEVLHAWPEYYDTQKGTWVMVDPTWENTTGGVDYFHTFDYDHMTLAIKGVSSTYPVPAGGYKLSGQESEKDVDVSFAPQSVEPQPVATALLDSPSQYLAGLPMLGTFSVANTGSVLFPTQLVDVQGIATQEYALSEIPPFGSKNISMDFGKTQLLTNLTSTITIRFADKTIEKKVRIAVVTLPVLLVAGGIIVAISSVIILIIARRPRRVSIP